MQAIVQTNDLCKYYGTGENMVKAADHINIAIEKANSLPSQANPAPESLRFCTFWAVWIIPQAEPSASARHPSFL